MEINYNNKYKLENLQLCCNLNPKLQWLAELDIIFLMKAGPKGVA